MKKTIRDEALVKRGEDFLIKLEGGNDLEVFLNNNEQVLSSIEFMIGKDNYDEEDQIMNIIKVGYILYKKYYKRDLNKDLSLETFIKIVEHILVRQQDTLEKYINIKIQN